MGVPEKKDRFDISYFIISFGGKKSGVFKKICDQVREWENKGLTFQVCVITDSGSAEEWRSICNNTQVSIDKSGIRRFLFRTIQLWKVSRQTLDTLYVREIAPLPFFRLSRKNSWILELQTIQENEIRERSKLKSVIYRFGYRTWFKNFDGFVCVSEEIKSKLKSDFAGKKSIVISNGVCLNPFQPLRISNLKEHPNFFFIGDLTQSWQGTNQIFEFASLVPQSEFHIVGPNNFVACDSPNIFIHGSLEREDYEIIAENCDVAFGTLNQRSTGMHEASPLKVREYLKWGLPVIGRYRDTDFGGDLDFFMALPDSPAPLGDFQQQIMSFAHFWKGRRVPLKDFQHLIDSRVKEDSRIAFFNVVRDSTHKSC
jgi:glycosyltransferase involved in cell wall biosynthesis